MRTYFLRCVACLVCFVWGQGFGQTYLDVENPSQEDICLYEKPQVGGALALIPNGETLVSLETLKKGDLTWHKVQFGDYTGYVNGKYLTESAGIKKAVVTYQQGAVTKLVLIHATSSLDGFCYLLTIDNKSQQVKIRNRFKCKFGIGGFVKQKEGDKKSPLGHYCVTSKSALTNDPATPDDDEVYNKFGGYNIHLNYPNVHDSKAKKTGGGICIHGGYSRPTEGCVRILDEGQDISTKNILTVGSFVTKGTHVLITNTIPPFFKQKPNTFLPAESYSFIQSACGKVCSHDEWKMEVERLLSSAAAPSEAPTTYGTIGPKANPPALNPILTPATPATSNNKPLEGYSAGYIKSSAGFANLRQKPSQEGKIIERIPTNQRISYKDNGTSWWEVVSEQGNKGYVNKGLIGK